MKALAVLFIVIAIGTAIRGWRETGPSSHVVLREQLSRDRLPLAQEKLNVAHALLNRDMASISKVKDPELVRLIVHHIKSGEPSNKLSLMRDITIAEEELSGVKRETGIIETERNTTMKWHYVPAVAFAVLGLVLLVAGGGASKEDVPSYYRVSEPARRVNPAVQTIEERLKSLEDLRRKNVISEEEYTAKRKSILDDV